MHTPDPSPTARPHPHPDAGSGSARDQDDGDAAELTREEEVAFAAHRRHISESSYLPATADYLHVR